MFDIWKFIEIVLLIVNERNIRMYGVILATVGIFECSNLGCLYAATDCVAVAFIVLPCTC